MSSLANSIKFPRLISSHGSFPIIGNSETCCLLVVTFYDPIFITRPFLFSSAFSGSQVFLYKSTIWLWHYSNYHLSKVFLLILRNFLARHYMFVCTRRNSGTVSPMGEYFFRDSDFSVWREFVVYSCTFSLRKICFRTFLYLLLLSSSR